MALVVNQSFTNSSSMTFLQLCQRLVQKCGISGTFLTTQNQTGEFSRVVNWINEAWLNIQQTREDWDWMLGSVQFNTAPQQATYNAAQCGIVDLAEWRMNTELCSFRTYNQSEGTASEIFLNFIGYDTWRDTYQYGSLRTSYSRPLTITVTPDMSIGLGQVPDSSNYVIVGEYFKTPSIMLIDSDVPALPARYHMLIVYLAMTYYAQYEEDDYLRSVADRDYTKMMNRLTVAQLPEVTFGAALA